MEPKEKNTWRIKFSVQSPGKSTEQLFDVANRCAAALRGVKSGIAPYDPNQEVPECYNPLLGMNSSDTFVLLLEARLDDEPVAPNRQYATTGPGFHERTVCIRVARRQDGSYGAS